MNEDWIESKLKDAEVPASGDGRERTVTLARAIAPERRIGLRSRVARPRVIVPLAALMIAAMTAPGQAATGQVGSIVARIVPVHAAQTATVVGTASTSGHGFTTSGNAAITSGSAGGRAFRPRPNGVSCGTLGARSGRVTVRPTQGKTLNAVPLRRARGVASGNAVGVLKAVPDRSR